MPKIMVVDDDKEFTTLYKEFLKMVGYETIAENQSSKAIEVANIEKPDLFILDLMMPEPDGFKLCRMLRANFNFVRTPIIIVTALNNEDSKLVALGAGANDYLTKPFHIDELKTHIDTLLKRSR
jgi:DNA-binding response OmpR family regulator